MSSDCNHIVSVLKRDGTDRQQLDSANLDPKNLKLHDFKISDWCIFAFNFAKKVRFFPTDSPEYSLGNWTKFFGFFTQEEFLKEEHKKAKTLEALKEAINDYLDNASSDQSLTPHLTLFIAFLKLLENSRERFNKLTKRHLDFYYKELLQIEKKPLTPDHVYIIFELAKNLSQGKVEKETSLIGGKDSSGIQRIYKTLEEGIINKTQIVQLKNVYNEILIDKPAITFGVDAEKSGNIVASPVANSLDGLGADFPEGSAQWWPFGHSKICHGSTQLPGLPKAKIGFSLASSMLNLQEGERRVALKFTFENELPQVDASSIQKAIKLEITQEKGWAPFDGLLDENTFLGEEGNPKQFHIVFNLEIDFPPLFPYQADVHGAGYTSESPIIRVIFNTETIEGYNLYRILNDNPLTKIGIDINASQIKNVQLENDLGAINSTKPFFPFTPRPLKGGSFKIAYPEATDKPWTSISISMDWLNTPDDFGSHYSAYGSPNSVGEIIPEVDDYSDFKVIQEPGESGSTTSQLNLFTEGPSTTEDGQILYQSNFSFNPPSSSFSADKKLNLSLVNTFLHEKYAHYYTQAAINNQTSINVNQIPNEPYTPLAENFTLSYSASLNQEISSTTENNDIQIFHEEPFGQYQKFPVKAANPVSEDFTLNLIPAFCHGGELYIGLEQAKPLQQISILFQILEGSENPNTPTPFEGKQKIEWAILSHNEWLSLDEGNILLNQTQNFLKTGLFKFSLPKLATQNNTRLPSGLFWLRASMKKNFDAVCQIIDIKTQALEATFEDQGNSGDHLKYGLPEGSIGKMKERLSTIKSISQPFPSFGGRKVEADIPYYRRISERLRHKQRAINLWDYEHLILESFPEIYKVKCLNHTSEQGFQSPGDVTVILIPDTIQQAVFDIYEPRVSQATLVKVGEFINQLNSFHVKADIINPNYEEVQIELKVKFHEGYDENFYLTQIQEDVKKFLSPWAYDQKATVEFGVTLHRSQIIHYLEQLDYVDYLENLKLLILAESSIDPCNPIYEEVTGKESVAPSNPKSILVTAKNHNVQLAEKKCSNEPMENSEPCQQ
ncbi:baseplate J/gp47 family protein [Echinicola jeungdonensis]|uniref:Baseplate J/gp47 family protein n=1 Tax=Echinicola jeungdonensis TaxID=709343 RepID=A0ABV5J6V0_9BACT|nr:baseplate J/gp47 family protein [Echinicola jeungdonensis]MDN3670816.1 baseplate J/gp47 family protein [Echinicola jeungdonensis]